MNRDLLFQQLLKDEGSRSFVYDDATGEPVKAGSTLIGNPTIGIGRELSKTGLSESEIRFMVTNDIDRIESALSALSFWGRLSENRKLVLANMAFNLGTHGLFQFVGMMAALEVNDYNRAANEILDSKAAKQLPNRYHRLARMMRE